MREWKVREKIKKSKRDIYISREKEKSENEKCRESERDE